jgi:hypothetical protein
MKREMLKVKNDASTSGSMFNQMKSELAAVMQQPEGNEPSHHSLALRALVNKWARCAPSKQQVRAADASKDDDGDAALAGALQRQAMVGELNADLAEFRTQRMQADVKASMARRTCENAQLLQENANLRREMKGLRDRLTVAERAQRATSIAAAEPVAALGQQRGHDDARVMRAIVEHTEQERDIDETMIGLAISPSWRAAPSRPVSGASTAAPGELSTRPQSAKQSSRPCSAVVQTSRAAQPASTSPRQRPHSAWVMSSPERARVRRPHSGSVVHGRPSRILNELMGREREQTSHLASQLEESCGVLAGQQEELRALKTLVKHLMKSDSGIAATRMPVDTDEVGISEDDGMSEDATQEMTAVPTGSASRAGRPISAQPHLAWPQRQAQAASRPWSAGRISGARSHPSRGQ